MYIHQVPGLEFRQKCPFKKKSRLMNFVSFGSLSKCRVVCASEELVLICPGCLSVRLCSRDSHVVPKKGIEQKLRVYAICVIRFTTVLVFFFFFFQQMGVHSKPIWSGLRLWNFLHMSMNRSKLSSQLSGLLCIYSTTSTSDAFKLESNATK